MRVEEPARTVGRCGYVAIVGRPNVGKSTFLNRVLGQKLSITSNKPQTTRHQILGVKTCGGGQILYVDTPGLQQREGRALHRLLNREAMRAITEVDVIVFMVEALHWGDEDEYVLNHIVPNHRPVILAVNKVDTVADKSRLLPYLSELGARAQFTELVPLSGRRGINVEALERALLTRLPRAPDLFAAEQLTDRNERFFAAELLRERLLCHLGAEVPHRLTVVIDGFSSQGGLTRIDATIWVERNGQKRIVVGTRGAVLKSVGAQARTAMERMFGGKVFLRTWVKVKENWSDDVRALQQLGYRA